MRVVSDCVCGGVGGVLVVFVCLCCVCVCLLCIVSKSDQRLQTLADGLFQRLLRNQHVLASLARLKRERIDGRLRGEVLGCVL